MQPVKPILPMAVSVSKYGFAKGRSMADPTWFPVRAARRGNQWAARSVPEEIGIEVQVPQSPEPENNVAP